MSKPGCPAASPGGEVSGSGQEEGTSGHVRGSLEEVGGTEGMKVALGFWLGQCDGDTGRRSGSSDAELLPCPLEGGRGTHEPLSHGGRAAVEQVSSTWTRSWRVWKEQDPGAEGGGGQPEKWEENWGGGDTPSQGESLPSYLAFLQLMYMCVSRMHARLASHFRVLATREFLEARTPMGPPATLPNCGLLNSDSGPLGLK